MDVILFHSGDSFPSYIGDCLSQLRHFNPTTNVHFLTDKKHMDNDVFRKYYIHTVSKDDYYTGNIATYEYLYGRGRDDFWTITATRLFYIAEFIRKGGIHSRGCIHFENDVLLYRDLREICPVLSSYQELAITVGGPDKCMTGFMYIPSAKALDQMLDYFLHLLRSSSLRDIKKRYGMDMVNEMTLMRAYSKDSPSKLRFLPILPIGDYSEKYDEFHSIFDPASWGQYVGGTRDGIPGAKPQDHYIGRLLAEFPHWTVVWKKGVPYFNNGKVDVRINNLHIHSKNLDKYLTK